MIAILNLFTGHLIELSGIIPTGQISQASLLKKAITKLGEAELGRGVALLAAYLAILAGHGGGNGHLWLCICSECFLSFFHDSILLFFVWQV